MLSKLPGVYSKKTGVRIFSRIYYSFLFLLFVMVMFADKEGLCLQDKLLNILEMFLFFLSFAAPVPVVYYMSKRGCKLPEYMFAVFLTMVIFMLLSSGVENFYTEEYKAEMYTQIDFKQK